MTDQSRWVLHVDLDQFIAAVEVLRRPELAGKPVIVGGRGDPTERAVVSTASYEARVFGVGSGMPLRIAARKIPDAVILPVDAPAYTAASEEVMATLRAQPGAVVQVLGWDEAFVGVHDRRPRGVRAAHPGGGARAHAAALQRRHRRHARARQDRDGLRQAARDVPAHRRELARGHGRPPDDRAVGRRHRRSRKRLAGLGIRTVTELARADDAALAAEFGPKMGPWYRQLGRGDGSAVVDDTPWVARGHSRETTFQQDLVERVRDRAGGARTARAGARGRRGRGPARRRGRAQGAVRAVPHQDVRAQDRRRRSTARPSSPRS